MSRFADRYAAWRKRRILTRAERLARRYNCIVVADRDLAAAACQIQKLHILVESSGYLAGKASVRKKLRDLTTVIWQHVINARNNGRARDEDRIAVPPLPTEAQDLPPHVHAGRSDEGRPAQAG